MSDPRRPSTRTGGRAGPDQAPLSARAARAKLRQEQQDQSQSNGSAPKKRKFEHQADDGDHIAGEDNDDEGIITGGDEGMDFGATEGSEDPGLESDDEDSREV